MDTPAGVTGGRSHRISPSSFCGAYLNFYREKDSAVPSRVSLLIFHTQAESDDRVCVCVIISFILDVGLVDAPAEVTHRRKVTQDFSTSFCGACLNFLARSIQPSLSLVNREADFFVRTKSAFSRVGHDFFFFFFCEEKI